MPMRLVYFLFASLIASWSYSLADNPTAVVLPYAGPDPGYILAESDGGLSNRLRVLAAYMHIAEAKHDGAHLVFVWDVNHACPGHFLQIFQPVQNVVFATNSSRYVLDKGAKIVFENSLAVFTWTLAMNNIPKNRFGQLSWGTIEHNMYSRYFPTREIMDKVTAFVQFHNICSASAMHLRATDLSIHLARKNKGVNIESYFAFVESRPVDEPVFLLTDNPDSQKLFLQKYGAKKILVYSVIQDVEHQRAISFGPILLTSTNESNSSEMHHPIAGNMTDQRVGRRILSDTSLSKHLDISSRKSKKLTEDHRFTTLEHALIDILIASHSKTFKPAMFSSMSDLVHMFANIGKKNRGWCS